MLFAGLPAATVLSGMSRVTMDPEPMMQLFPMLTPGSTITLLPRKQLWPIEIRPILACPVICIVLASCAMSLTLGAKVTLLPISINQQWDMSMLQFCIRLKLCPMVIPVS